MLAADTDPLTDPTPLETEEGCTGDDVVTVFTTVGETDQQLMQAIETQFNTDFSSQGFTASYDPTADVLSIGHLLWSPYQFYFDDTDTGLLGDLFAEEYLVIPEPASVLLLGAGLILLGARRRAGVPRRTAE